MKNEILIPMQAVLNMLEGLCSDCSERVRQRLASQTPYIGTGTPHILARIFKDVCMEMQADPQMVLAKNNTATMVQVRRVIAYRARKAGFSYPEIGRALNRHHTSVINLFRKDLGAYRVLL